MAVEVTNLSLDFYVMFYIYLYIFCISSTKDTRISNF